MSDGLCWDAAIVSIQQLQLLGAHPGRALARLTKPELQALLGQNRRALLSQGLTLGGLKCMVIRDNLYTDSLQFTMDLRTKPYRDNEGCYTRAITVILVNPVCLILIGKKGIQGGTLNMKAFEVARYIKDTMRQQTCTVKDVPTRACTNPYN